MEGVLLFNRFLELDPGRPLQKARHVTFLRALPAGQNYREHSQSALSSVDTALDRQAHFFVVPRTESMRTKENHACVALAKRSFDCWLPGITGNEVPLVQPAEEPTVLQFISKFLDQRLLSAVMG